MNKKDYYSKLAEHEIGWWKAHHRKDKILLVRHMTRLYELQFGISYKNAVKAINYRVKATIEHDAAEKLEDIGNQTKADIHWRKAEKLLAEHFRILMECSERHDGLIKRNKQM